MFSKTMVGFHGAEPAAVAAAYDYSKFATIVDVGGATGISLQPILGRHPKPRGILFDMPHVVGDAPGLLKTHGSTDRIAIESGVSSRVFPRRTAFICCPDIIHDWSEAQCLTILGNCRPQ